MSEQSPSDAITKALERIKRIDTAIAELQAKHEAALAFLQEERYGWEAFVRLHKTLDAELPYPNLKRPISAVELLTGGHTPLERIINNPQSGLEVLNRIRESTVSAFEMGRAQSKKDLIATTSWNLLHRESPLRTRDIVVELERLGIEITGKEMADKVTTVSAILSKDERFVPDRANGWTLNI